MQQNQGTALPLPSGAGTSANLLLPIISRTNHSDSAIEPLPKHPSRRPAPNVTGLSCHNSSPKSCFREVNPGNFSSWPRSTIRTNDKTPQSMTHMLRGMKATLEHCGNAWGTTNTLALRTSKATRYSSTFKLLAYYLLFCNTIEIVAFTQNPCFSSEFQGRVTSLSFIILSHILFNFIRLETGLFGQGICILG